MIRAFTSCALLLALLVQQSVIAAEAEAEWFFDVEVSGGYNDNAGRAERERDIVDDKTLLGGLGVAFNQEFSTEKAITLRAFAEIEDFRNVSDLSRDTYGAQFIYRWQNALGFSAPFYQFNTSVRINEYDVRQRDSIAFTSQLVVSKRVSDRVLVSSGFEYKREESDGIVFDQKQARLFINADYTPAAQWALYGTYSFIHGDIWSTSQTAFCDGTPANDIFDLVSQSE
ncbi:MAG: hypothetical protein OES99_10715, partial [Gammaproteobacteria bacterium]|nr:hypothetical protein [Gammaproteobacteria bacterium]